MLIRLLVALLTLVGPMPFRVCTCAASAPAQTPADKPATATPTPPKRCGCVRCAPTKDVASAAGDTATHAGTHTMPAGDAPRSNQSARAGLPGDEPHTPRQGRRPAARADLADGL